MPGPPVTLALQNLGDNSIADFNFRQIEMFLGVHGPILNELRQTASRAPGGFDSDTQGQLVIFGAAIINTGTGLGSSFGVGVTGVSSAATGVVTVTLTKTFPTYTLFGVTVPTMAVAGSILGGSAVSLRCQAATANTITFQTLNTAGVPTDAHFWFAGIGTLAP